MCGCVFVRGSVCKFSMNTHVHACVHACPHVRAYNLYAQKSRRTKRLKPRRACGKAPTSSPLSRTIGSSFCHALILCAKGSPATIGTAPVCVCVCAYRCTCVCVCECVCVHMCAWVRGCVGAWVRAYTYTSQRFAARQHSHVRAIKAEPNQYRYRYSIYLCLKVCTYI